MKALFMVPILLLSCSMGSATESPVSPDGPRLECSDSVPRWGETGDAGCQREQKACVFMLKAGALVACQQTGKESLRIVARCCGIKAD